MVVKMQQLMNVDVCTGLFRCKFEECKGSKIVHDEHGNTYTRYRPPDEHKSELFAYYTCTKFADDYEGNA